MKTCPVDCRERVRCFCRYTSPAPLARTRKPPTTARDLEYIRTFREGTQTGFNPSGTVAMWVDDRRHYHTSTPVVLKCQYDLNHNNYYPLIYSL